jgi:hypothetical protein
MSLELQENVAGRSRQRYPSDSEGMYGECDGRIAKELEQYCGDRGHIQRYSGEARREMSTPELNMSIDTSGENDRTECILEGHLQFMRDFVGRDEARNKATLNRFLASRLRQQGKACQEQSKLF